MDSYDVQFPFIKAASAAGAYGAAKATTLADFTAWMQAVSATAAAIYGCAVAIEWVIKKVRAHKAKRHAKAAA